MPRIHLICQICGKDVDKDAVFLNEAPHYTLCPECAKAFWTCSTCSYGKNCKLQENPDHIPQVVNQVVRQGGMVIQQQVVNPELIKRTCQAGCRCYHAESGTCFKQNLGNCPQHELDAIYATQK